MEPGDLVQPGRVLFEIARDGGTEIEAPVDEKNLGVLAMGQTRAVHCRCVPDTAYCRGRNYLAPAIDPQLGTVTMRLKVDPMPGFLRQDMTVSVNIETGSPRRALAVPNDALLDAAGDRPAVLRGA